MSARVDGSDGQSGEGTDRRHCWPSGEQAKVDGIAAEPEAEGLTIEPKLVIGDLGFWAATREVYSKAREQR